MLKNLELYSRRILSNINNVCIVADEVISFLQGSYGNIADTTLFEIKVILNELILNAIKHGNKGDEKKYVQVDVRIAEEENVHLTVADRGEGYDYKDILKTNCCMADFFDDVCNLKETGRGILIVRNLCDSIQFNKKRKQGNGNKKAAPAVKGESGQSYGSL